MTPPTNKHQGKFHLLAVFGIPVLLVLLFLVQNWWITGGFVLLMAIVTWLLFRK